MATNKRPRKAYKRIGFEDRKKIEALNAQGKTVDEMAMAIGVHSATMYRELARGGEPYKAEVAQHSIPHSGNSERMDIKIWQKVNQSVSHSG